MNVTHCLWNLMWILLICLWNGGFIEAAENCAVLYSQPNLQGSQYTIPSYAQYSTIEDDNFLDSYNSWNDTRSLSVTTNCRLVACTQRYFRGKCQEFNNTNNNVTSDLLGTIVAIKCHCQKEDCESIHGPVRRGTCARAYLGSQCEVYVEFTGSSPSFSEERASEITTLKVKEGCSLTIYDEEEYEGGTIVLNPNSGVNQANDWGQQLKSYECTCAPQPEVQTVINTSTIAQLEIPGSMDAISDLINGQQKGHKGLEAALESAKNRRSPKNAYILVLGTTGSGKSSLINLLLNKNLTEAGDAVSTTSSILEFRIPVPLPELGITNSQVRVIDTPGLGDTRGLEYDARFLASLDKFLSSHEELSDRIPNAVLIVHPFKDNRFSGKSSVFIKMLRGLDQLRNRITDDAYSNVVFVLSHFMSGSQKDDHRNPWSRLQEFKQAIQDYSVFPKPIVLAVGENKGTERHLPLKQGSYLLPNGDLYPRNVISKIKLAMTKGGDPIGESIVSKAFDHTMTGNFNASEYETKLITPNDSASNGSVTKYFDILSASELNIETTEVSKLLATAAQSLDDQLLKTFPGSLVYLQKALSTRGIHNVSDIPKTELLVAQLLTSLDLNQVVEMLLDKGLSVKVPKFRQEVLVGKSYSFLRDTPLSVSPIQPSEPELSSKIGYTFPPTMSCIPHTSVVDKFRIYRSKAEYVESRRNTVGMTEDVNPSSFSGSTPSGNNIISQSQQGLVTISALREYRVFKLELTDALNGSESFLRDLRSLQPFNETNYDSAQSWNNFFQKYGTHVVNSIYGGGSIEIKVTVNASAVQNVGRRIFDFIDFADKIKLSDSFVNLNSTEHILTFRGGDSNHKTTDLTKMSVQDASVLLGKWKKSLILRPEIIHSSLSLMPLSQIAKKFSGGDISSRAISEAASRLLAGTLQYTPSKLVLAELERCKEQKAEATKKFEEQKATITTKIAEVKTQIAQRRQQMNNETSQFMKDLLVLQGEETQLKEVEVTKNELLDLRKRCEAHKMTVYKY